jgi:hypothetical protein
MVREIRIYWALRFHLKQIASDLDGIQMNLSLNTATQLLATLGQTLNAFGGIVPADKRVWVAASLALIQGILAAMAQFRNPDGTPASQPYVAPSK